MTSFFQSLLHLSIYKSTSYNLDMEAKKLVPEKFHRWIKVFSKKQLERMPT